MRSVRGLIVLVIGLLLVAACGGGSSETDKASPRPTTPTYSAEQLQAALPTVKDVPHGKKVVARCPGADYCPKMPDSDQRLVALEMTPVSSSDKEAEDTFFLAQIAEVSATRERSAAAATAAVTKARKTKVTFDGTFETKAVKTKGTSYTPGERGKGTFDDATVEGWTGYRYEKTYVLTSPSDKESEPRQEAGIEVSVGRQMLSVRVMLGGYEVRDGAAAKLADSLIREYLERLG